MPVLVYFPGHRIIKTPYTYELMFENCVFTKMHVMDIRRQAIFVPIFAPLTNAYT